MDINQQITEATEKYIAEHLQETIEKNVDLMMADILKDIFRSYGETGKSIKKKIEEKLDVNLQRFDLVDYNVMISKVIKDNLLYAVNETSLIPIQELIKDIVGVVKVKEIKISDIYEEFRDGIVEDSSYGDTGTLTFIVKENTKYGWYQVFVDEEEKSERDCAVKFLIDNKDGKIFSFKYNDKIVSPSTMIGISGLEKKIFRLYNAQTKIIIDNTEFDQEWLNECD